MPENEDLQRFHEHRIAMLESMTGPAIALPTRYRTGISFRATAIAGRSALCFARGGAGDDGCGPLDDSERSRHVDTGRRGTLGGDTRRCFHALHLYQR